ncbi:MAG: SRPBCC family protein [Proteobacteria bacterium]|nr:SRPBCC family protein [Pseudomonadota bacterium]MCP4922333.1 SRPBCC family protein [Pseudomonadota bacterium]
MQPASTHVERSLTVAATPADVFPHIDDVEKLHLWGVWSEVDPNATYVYSEPRTGVGAWYTWDGNDDVGEGKLTTIASVENQSVQHELEFFRPFESQSVTGLSLAPDGDGTKVTWTYDQDNDFMGKAMSLMMDMDTMLGPDFEQGLANLQVEAEKSAAQRKAMDELREQVQAHIDDAGIPNLGAVE